MIYLLEWWRFVMMLLRSLYQSYIKIVLKQVSILIHRKKSNIVPVHKKGDKQIVNNHRPVSRLPIFGKFSRKSYLIPFLNTFKRIVFFVIINQVFDLLIHVSINYFLLFMIFMHLLIVTHPKMWEGYFLIYLKPLIEYGMKGSATKWNVLV